MRVVHWILVVSTVMLAASIGLYVSRPEAAAPVPFKTDLGVQRLMQLVVDPAADQLWTSVSTTVTEQGVEETFPRNDEEWEAVRYGAAVLVESGNLMMMGSRARDNGDWLKMAAGLTDAGTAALKAAEAKDVDAVFKTGGEVYQACTNCHEQYWSDDPRAQF